MYNLFLFIVHFVFCRLNTRNSTFTEIVGSNSVHPADAGYYQMADSMYYSFYYYIING